MKNLNPFVRRSLSALLLLLSIFLVSALAQTTVFTYQGRFTDAGVQQPTNGTYSMTFRLYDALSGGSQIGSPITRSVSVVGGVFSAPLDFGATAFNTTGARYLEIQVGASVLTPRQEITSAPFARKASNAGAADSLSTACAGCVTDSQINTISGSKVTGTVSNAGTAGTATNAQQLGGVAASGYLQNSGSGANLTNLNASNLGSGTVPDARLSSNVTVQGNTFNGANQLVKLDANGKLPAVDGSQLTNLSGGSSVAPFAARSTPLVLNSGTLVDIVSIALPANKTYFVEGNIIGNRVGATSGGARCRTTYSGTATTDYGLQQNGTLYNFTTIDSAGVYDSESTGQAASTPWAGTVTYRYLITGYLRTSTAGTLTISCARASFNTTVDINVREGSYLNARPLN